MDSTRGAPLHLCEPRPGLLWSVHWMLARGGGRGADVFDCIMVAAILT